MLQAQLVEHRRQLPWVRNRRSVLAQPHIEVLNARCGCEPAVHQRCAQPEPLQHGVTLDVHVESLVDLRPLAIERWHSAL